ncbi:MAG: TIGR04282 family arsenosugar biosynthesis glycosyltransferase [Methyloceanibacter sp.]|uniref:TIGR04282 family arsenosugar biosynthesis glycosyltransferase n=1 Tax=Methyloceanibacter sp. TaxID=1965321 RepID=UPI003D6CA190
MAKLPAMGRVKRRLAREIGDGAAIRFYRACLNHTVLRLASDPRWRTLLAVAPDTAVAARCWPSPKRLVRIPQGAGDLGVSMQRLFDTLPPGPVVIVGSDIPGIRPAHIASAFALLGRADAVFGPAPDGGYWLVGQRRSPRRLVPFARVPWSTAEALAATLDNLSGKIVAFAPRLSDVDTIEDYRREGDLAERLVPSFAP